MQTTCKDCVFNKQITYSETVRSSVICELGRYEKFIERGQVKPPYSDTLSVLCTACRNVPTTTDEIAKQLQNAYALVIVDREEGDALERVKVSLSERQSIDPKEIVVVFKSESDFAGISRYLEEYVKGTKTRFFIKWIPDEEYKDEMIDLAVKELTSISYTLIKGGESLPYNCLELIYKYVDVELKQFVVITPIGFNSNTGLTILRLFHSYVNGNFSKSILEKVDEAVQQEKNYHMIASWFDVRLETTEIKCEQRS